MMIQQHEEERREWKQSWDSLLEFASVGPFEKEIVHAKEFFFSKLGRAHETIEDLYESASQTFLEWYLFDYATRPFHKSPAVTYVTLGQDTELKTQIISRCLWNHWSWFRVEDVGNSILVVQDLLANKERRLPFSPRWPEYEIWRAEKGQIIQARLFPYRSGEEFFFTHFWLHPERESSRLVKIADKVSQNWSPQLDLLLSSFEATVKSFQLQTQLKASQASNWYYQELEKKYA
jgi:hypothetical protein